MIHLTPQDVIGEAQARGLAPKGSGREVRIQCPDGCGSGHTASLSTAADKCGVWHCHRCEASGVLRAEGDKPARPYEPEARRTRAPIVPIPMPEGWGQLADAQTDEARDHVERWALARGWPAWLASAARSCPDALWADVGSRVGREGARVAAHALDVQRPLVVALRDGSGQVKSIMRRAAPHWRKTEGPKAMAAYGEVMPMTEGSARILGSVQAWVEAAAAGKLVAVVEGEPDFLTLDAWARAESGDHPACPVAAVVGAPSCGQLVRLAEVLAGALEAQELSGGRLARVVLLPDRGDRFGQGEEKMGRAGEALRKAGALTGTVLLPLGPDGSADVAEVLVRCGAGELARQIEECAPRLVWTGEGWAACGDEVWEQVHLDGQTVRRVVGHHLWAIARTQDADGGGMGLRYRAHTSSGRVVYGSLRASAWALMREAGEVGAALALAGVQVRVRKGGECVCALGHHARASLPCITVAQGAGWVDDPDSPTGRAYLHGAEVIRHPKARGVWVAEGVRPSGVGGDAATWRQGMAEALGSPVICAAVGVSLAGALVGLLGRRNFGLHIAGKSSSGKSVAAWAASSVWRCPAPSVTWTATANGGEGVAASHSGALLYLDDLGRSTPEVVADTAHRFAGGTGKTRMTRSGELRRCAAWSSTLLSTGEVTVREFLGVRAQGGHLVRLADVPIQRGEATRDAAQARAIERLYLTHYGHAGRAWARWLVELDAQGLERLRVRVDEAQTTLEGYAVELGAQAEAVRIVEGLALVYVAADEAREAGILPACDPWGATLWTLARILESRQGAQTPEERAWEALRRHYQTQPASWPHEAQMADARGLVLGVSQPHPKGGWVWTSETMLGAWPGLTQAGVSARGLIEWAQSKGLGAALGRGQRVAGLQRRWVALDLRGDVEPESDGD